MRGHVLGFVFFKERKIHIHFKPHTLIFQKIFIFFRIFLLFYKETQKNMEKLFRKILKNTQKSVCVCGFMFPDKIDPGTAKAHFWREGIFCRPCHEKTYFLTSRKHPK